MDEASHCGRLGFIYNGRVIAEGSPQQIRTERVQDCIIELEVDDTDAALAWLESSSGLGEAYLSGALLHVNAGEQDEKCVERLAGRMKEAGFELARCQRIEPSIEDVFVHMVAHERAKQEASR
jgi:ABC-2 type transport system ATP-binding protein